jgi:hypothetical protein
MLDFLIQMLFSDVTAYEQGFGQVSCDIGEKHR